MSDSVYRIRKENTNTLAHRKRAALARETFYNQNHFAIVNHYLREDLINVYCLEDIPKLKYITFDFFVPQFLQRLVNVYNVPPVISFDKTVVKKYKVDIDRFYKLMEEIDYQKSFQESAYKCRLHNTVLDYVRFSQELNKVYVSSDYNISNCEIVTFKDYAYDLSLVAYEQAIKNDLVYYVWDRVNKEHYYVKGKFEHDKEKGVLGKRYPISGNEDSINPFAAPDYWPFSIRRYKQQDEDFWGYGLDSIIELNRVINVLSVLGMDDIIMETLKIWLFNFNPNEAGHTKGSDGRIKIGGRNPLWYSAKIGDTQPTGQVISAPLNTEQIIGFSDSLADRVSTMFGIENVLRTQLHENLSGISLRLRNEPLLRQWNEDINIMRGADIDEIENVVAVNNHWRRKNSGLYDIFGNLIEDNYINPVILDFMQVDYQEPYVVTDEIADFELSEKQASKGLISWVQEFLKKNPEKSAEEAEKTITDNIEKNRNLTGMSFNINVNNEKELAGEENDNKEAE